MGGGGSHEGGSPVGCRAEEGNHVDRARAVRVEEPSDHVDFRPGVPAKTQGHEKGTPVAPSEKLTPAAPFLMRKYTCSTVWPTLIVSLGWKSGHEPLERDNRLPAPGERHQVTSPQRETPGYEPMSNETLLRQRPTTIHVRRDDHTNIQ